MGYNYDSYFEYLRNDGKDGNIKVNCLYPILQKQYDSNETLSIIGECDPIPREKGLYVNGLGEDTKEEYWYGLHPDISVDAIFRNISSKAFYNLDNFEEFLSENKNYFTIPKKDAAYAKALFAKTIVKMLTNFGVKIKADREAFDYIKEKFEEESSCFFPDVNYDLSCKNGELSVKFLGALTESSYQFLHNCKELVVVDDTIKLNSDNNISGATSLAEYLINKERGDSGFAKFVLVKGTAYYNGVLPRVTKIANLDQKIANNSLSSYCIHFERTTYATMDALDNSYIKQHPLLVNYVGLLDKLDAEEEKYQKEVISQLPCKKFDLEIINTYLDKSLFTHTLAVSGNIVTSDGYCVFALRDRRNVDANTVYCSVNGQSEIKDKKVEFYSYSCDADYPTITYEPNEKVRFTQEIEREAKAELNIALYEDVWECCGLSFLCIDNSKAKQSDYHRFHFNLLFTNKVPDSFAKLRKKTADATEKYENKDIIGIRVKSYANPLTKFGSYCFDIFKAIFDSKDFVTSIIALAIFISGLVMHESVGSGDLFNMIFTVIIGVFAGILIAKNLVVYLKERLYLFNFRIINKENDAFLLNAIKILSRKKRSYADGITLHPIAVVMLYMYCNKYAKKTPKKKARK